ncbi:AAA family ATPase [Pseudoalteromonas sp. TB64]|uniref:AAA family ATPase n=1 Tax=Pseudoalteromonas sp. TB64 TaxID=1938600 RepID=UPI0003F8C293|nr:AAA family ATPase [Pseudoalteromonas sp. TB64]
MITDISLENFAAFKKLELQFTPGINIIIGENSCGKTQLLKAIYALSSNQDITEKLLGLYKPSSGKLSGIYFRGGKGKAKATITDSSGQTSAIEFGSRTEKAKKESEFIDIGLPVLLPTKEVLSLLPAIQANTVSKEALSALFDDSVIDLCHMLLTEPDADLTDAVNNDPRLGDIIPMLVKAIGGKFEINGTDHAFVKGTFVEKTNPDISTGQSAKVYADFKQLIFKREKLSETSVTMTAEGYRKIGLLQRLIDTGALVKGKTNVLLWDEPESNMNPILMKLLVQCMLDLSRNGQQIIIATHDYVLLKWFDLLINENKGDHIKYHSLYRNETDDSVEVITTEEYLDLTPNAIDEAFGNLIEQEIVNDMGGLGK